EIPADSEIIVAIPNFFTLDAFEPSFEKILVCFDKKNTIQIVYVFMGETQKLSPAIKFDKEVVLLPFSFRNEANEITIFTLDGDRKVTCFTITSDYNLNPAFSFTFDYSLTKYGLKNSLFITGGPDLIHLVSFGNGLIHTILDFKGNRVKETILSRHRDVPVYLNASLVKDTVKVIYYAGNNNYIFFQSSFSGTDGNFSKIEKKIRLVFGLDDLIEDIDFLYNKDNALQLAYSTTSGRLIYGDEYLGFKTILKNRNIRYPRLITGDNEMFRPFVGFSTPKNGYRFYNIEGSEPWRKLQSITM
ncbi:MAG: hypothetical protein GX640_19300, partial [Fibrobacter sp.]|nr:hypothetical protein [Fibrobacter sp.]